MKYLFLHYKGDNGLGIIKKKNKQNTKKQTPKKSKPQKPRESAHKTPGLGLWKIA